VSNGKGSSSRPVPPPLEPGPGGGHPGIDGAPTTTGDEPLNLLAAAVRRISAVAIGQPLNDDEISAAAADLGDLADRLESAASGTKRRRNQPGPNGFPGVHPQDYFPTSPMVGYANPIAPPLEVWAVAGDDGRREVRGRVTFDYPYEGPPTCVHGGVIAELFDELLGLSNILVGLGAMTGTLTVRYRRPTPLLAPLELAARNTAQDGRKVYAWGGIYHEGELTAEAEGVFIHVPPARMLDIVTGNADGSAAGTPPLVDAEWQRMMARARDAQR
jgi:acyl-coenzyme A thioesterase PaaI-like protein